MTTDLPDAVKADIRTVLANFPHPQLSDDVAVHEARARLAALVAPPPPAWEPSEREVLALNRYIRTDPGTIRNGLRDAYANDKRIMVAPREPTYTDEQVRTFYSTMWPKLGRGHTNVEWVRGQLDHAVAAGIAVIFPDEET